MPKNQNRANNRQNSIENRQIMPENFEIAIKTSKYDWLCQLSQNGAKLRQKDEINCTKNNHYCAKSRQTVPKRQETPQTAPN